MTNNLTVCDVFAGKAAKPVAKIALNGYNIDAGSSFDFVGAMRSFKIIEGESAVWEHWVSQRPLQINDTAGNAASIRIYAAPGEAGGLGFVEFL